jgi:hypothetical protein
MTTPTKPIAEFLAERATRHGIERKIENRLRLAVQSAVLRFADVLNESDGNGNHLHGVRTAAFLEEIEAHQRDARALRKALETLEAVLIL